MCKIRWNSDAFLPLCCLVDLWRCQKLVLPQKTNTPMHQFWKYLPEKWDLSEWYSCRCRDNLLFPLKGFGLVFLDVFHVWPLTIPPTFLYSLLGRWYRRLHSAGAKLRGTVEIVDIDIDKTFCYFRFMILHMLVMYADLILFSATPNTGGFDVSFCWKNDLKNRFWPRQS